MSKVVTIVKAQMVSDGTRLHQNNCTTGNFQITAVQLDMFTGYMPKRFGLLATKKLR